MKPKYGKPLKHFTIRVTEDQYDFLQKLDNASEWLRNAIDSKMFEETTDVLAVVRRIEYLEKEKHKIYNSADYKLAKFITDYEQLLLKNLIKKQPEQAEKPPIEFGYDSWETRIICCKVYGLEFSRYFRESEKLITQADLQDFLNENNLKITSLFGNKWDRKVFLRFLTKVKQKITYMRKVYQKYTAKVAEIQTEIGALRQKIMSDS